MPDVAADTVAALAARLRAAAGTGTPCAPVRHDLPEKDLAAAYAVQQANTDDAVARGRRIVGRKIGLTAKAVQRQLGVDQPDYGVLFADMIFAGGDTLNRAALLQPKLESEVAFVLARDLPHADTTVVEAMRATDFVVPAFEIVASRIRDWDIDIVDTIADNASAGAMVLGSRPVRLADVDLATVSVATCADGTLVSSGAGRACLGHPLNAVVWLARRMAALGTPLVAGDIVMSGALGPMATPGEARHVTADFAGLGGVEFFFS